MKDRGEQRGRSSRDTHCVLANLYGRGEVLQPPANKTRFEVFLNSCQG